MIIAKRHSQKKSFAEERILNVVTSRVKYYPNKNKNKQQEKQGIIHVLDCAGKIES